MKPARLAVAASLAVLVAGAARAAESPTVAPVDQPTRLGGVDVVCTGFGLAAREDPKWQAYGVRIEFSNARNEYLAGAVVTVRNAAGRVIVSAACDAPWLLMRLPPGDYRAEAQLTSAQAKPRSAAFRPPASGQMRVVLQFPDAS